MNEKIGMYTEEEIFQEIAHGFLGRSMYDAIFDKIHALKTENEQLKQENARLKEFKKEHEIMKKILIEKGLWETLLNDDRFLEYLREEN